ncbi:MAG: hypothetical protein AAB740_02155 [Patescibacteria group bacterium]
MKLKEKIKAIQLRKAGKSYGEIMQKIKVPKSTLSMWLRDVELTEQQKNRLYVTLRRQNAYKGAKLLQERRILRTEKIITEAKKEAQKMFKNPLFLSGLMLYWAEGDKSERFEHVKFSNSDPAMVQLIMRWFREICKTPESKFRICLHIHSLHCRKDILQYWSQITGIPLSQFYKTQVKPTSLKHRRNVLYNGTCAVAVGDRWLFRRIKGWRLGIMEILKLSNEPS